MQSTNAGFDKEWYCFYSDHPVLQDQMMPQYAEMIYNGFWFSPERIALQQLIDKTSERVTGSVRVKLYKGLASVVGRKSPYSLYNAKIASFEDDGGLYDQVRADSLHDVEMVSVAAWLRLFSVLLADNF